MRRQSTILRKSQTVARSGGKCALGAKIKQIDSFGQNFTMNLDRAGHHVRTSYCGAAMTALLLFMLGFYTYLKSLVLLNRKDVTIMENTITDAFNET